MKPLPENYRVTHGPCASDNGNSCGFFVVPFNGLEISVSVSQVMDAEHIGVSLIKSGKMIRPQREEVFFIKNIFFEDTEAVAEMLPPRRGMVNEIGHVVHLYRLPQLELFQAWESQHD